MSAIHLTKEQVRAGGRRFSTLWSEGLRVFRTIGSVRTGAPGACVALYHSFGEVMAQVERREDPQRRAAVLQFQVPASQFTPGTYTGQVNIIDAVANRLRFRACRSWSAVRTSLQLGKAGP